VSKTKAKSKKQPTVTRDRIVELRRVKASELKPHPLNWRSHPKKQRDAVNGLINEVGYAAPLVARQCEDGTLQLIDGHLRADLTPAAEVPVVVLDVTEKEASKLLAALDPTTNMAETMVEQLEQLLGELTTEDAGLAALFDGLRQTLNIGMPGEIIEDEIPAPPDKAITEPGDIWILGEHRLMCGDSSDADHLDRLLAGARIHLANTDPPYNVNVEPRSNNAIAAGLSSFGGTTHHQPLDVARHPSKSKPTGKKLRAKDRPLANDSVSEAEFERLLGAWFGNIARVLEPGRAFYIWGCYANVANYPPALKACELYLSQAIIWIKGHPVLTRKDFMGNHEWCFYGWREGAAHIFLGPKNVPDTWEIKKVTPQKMIHLTEKPVELAARAIGYSTRPGENVLDLFGGSGSTLMAAEQTGRRAYLMELDQLYCDIVVSRWEVFTGQKAVRVGRDTAAHVAACGEVAPQVA
jgi:DNA modification methylase